MSIFLEEVGKLRNMELNEVKILPVKRKIPDSVKFETMESIIYTRVPNGWIVSNELHNYTKFVPEKL